MRVLVLLALLLTPLIAETIHLESPVNVVVTPVCSESIAMTGMLHGVIHITRNEKFLLMESHVGPRNDATAVNLATGVTYSLAGQTMNRLRFEEGVLKSYTAVNNFMVVGLYRVHYNYHFVFENGGIEASADHFTVDCE